jgi:diadenosine tetraphosphate (Ap4A) HIT family hydrolase
MSIPDFTDTDLARLTLSTQLQKLSEAFRVAVAAPDEKPDADGDVSLAGRLETLLATEVPALRAAIADYLGTVGDGSAPVDARAPHIADPTAAAAALDAWYVRHAQLEPLARVGDPFTRLLSGRTPGGRECLVCAKYAGRPVPAWAGFPTPPGGHLVDDGLWRVGHGPTPYWPKGTLLIESKRHFLDYGEFTPDEAATLGPLIQRLTGPLKRATGAPRIHLFACMEGTEHCHLWMVPRVPGATESRTFIADPGYCTPTEAEDVIREVRRILDAGRPVAEEDPR